MRPFAQQLRFAFKRCFEFGRQPRFDFDAPPLAPPIPSDPWSAWAQAFCLTDPNGDADGDGFTNLQECQSGTDPLDPRSNPGTTGTTDPGTITLIIRPPRLIRSLRLPGRQLPLD